MGIYHLVASQPDVSGFHMSLQHGCLRLGGPSPAGNKERTGQAVEEDVNYLMNIVENLGSDAARQYYWDFGRWSDLWRVWRPPGDDRLPGDGIDLQATRCPCHDSVQ